MNDEICRVTNVLAKHPLGRLLLGLIEAIDPSYIGDEPDADARALAELAEDERHRARLLDFAQEAAHMARLSPHAEAEGGLYDVHLLGHLTHRDVRVAASGLVYGGVYVTRPDGTPVGTFGPSAVYAITPREEEEARPDPGPRRSDLSSGAPDGAEVPYSDQPWPWGVE